MTKNSAPYVTETIFKQETQAIWKEIKAIHLKLDTTGERLDKKIDTIGEQLDKKIDTAVDRLSLAIVKTQEDVRKIRDTMSTKEDIDRVLTQMAEFSNETRIVLRNQEVHVGYLRDHELRLQALEKRPAPYIDPKPTDPE